MNKNLGSADRIVRIVMGLLMLWLGGMLMSWWGLLGLIPLLTGLMGWCMPYHFLGVNTCGARPHRSVD